MLDTFNNLNKIVLLQATKFHINLWIRNTQCKIIHANNLTLTYKWHSFELFIGRLSRGTLKFDLTGFEPTLLRTWVSCRNHQTKTLPTSIVKIDLKLLHIYVMFIYMFVYVSSIQLHSFNQVLVKKKKKLSECCSKNERNVI